MNKWNKYISAFSAFLVFCLAIAAFFLSFDAVRLEAIALGVREDLAWLYPVIIDGAIVVFSLAVVRASINNEPTRYNWLMIIAATIASLVFNVSHALATDGRSNIALAVFMSVLPPLALAFGFHSIMDQLERSVRRVFHVQSIADLRARIDELRAQLTAVLQEVETAKTEQATIQQTVQAERETLNKQTAELRQAATAEHAALMEQLNTERDKVTAEIEQLKAERQTLNVDDTDRLLLHFVAKYPNASYREIGEFVNKSPGTVGGYIKRLSDAGLLHKNGQGYEVRQP